MNIWIFNHYAKPPIFAGGSRHYDMATELIKEGHDVTIFTSSFIHSERREYIEYDSNEFFRIEIIDNIKFVWIKTKAYGNAFNRILNALQYYKNVKKTSEYKEFLKPDLIIGSAVHLLAPLLASKLAKKYNAKFYFEERDFWPQTFVDFGKISKKNPITLLLYRLEKSLYVKADRIIVLFDKANEYVESKGISSKKIIYLPNGIAPKENIHNSKLENIYTKVENCFKIIYIGSYGQANELNRILELAFLMKDAKDVKFMFFGSGPLKGELLEFKFKNNLENVEFHDQIPKSNITYLLSKADLGIISIKDSPLYKYGFSMNKIYDYLYAGLPLIMIIDKKLGSSFDKEGIFVNNNLEIQKQNIINLKNDKILYEKYSEESKLISKNFLWENQIKKLTSEFEK